VDAWIRQGTVVLEGAVSSLSDKQRAVQVAGAYGKVIDLLSIQGAEATTGASVSATNVTVAIDPTVHDAKLRGKLTELGALIGDSNLRLNMINDTLVLDGSLADTYAQERARRLASLYFPQVLDVSAIRGPGVQVALKVHVLEVDRTGVGELGVAWGSMNRGVLDTNAFYVGELAMDWQLKRLMMLGAKINTLVDDGHAKILAAPTLLTLSGGTASFLAGGEIPITMPQGENKYSVEWKEYGIRLQVKPIVDASGYVTVSLTPEVSTLDWANAVRISTIALPALRTRRTETQVRVADGATLVLGGLISREESKQATKMPFISELPVIGRLFRSDKFSNGETELLFLVTPHVLREGESLAPEAVVLPGGLEPDGKESSVSRPKVLEMVP
jgi:pilus assembly protein CpaC